MATPLKRIKGEGKIAKLLDKIDGFDISTIFNAKRRPPTAREVLVNVEHSPETFVKEPKVKLWSTKGKTAEDGTATPKKHIGFGSKIVARDNYQFESNQVLTSKYNIFTFLPRNLLEQFRRVANIFFLALVVLQFFSRFATVSPGLAMLPLIVVLLITALKDGYEDLKRHQSDRSINNIKVWILGGAFQNPNFTRPKQRTFGFGLGWFSNSKKEEQDRERARQGFFWGRRKRSVQEKTDTTLSTISREIDDSSSNDSASPIIAKPIQPLGPDDFYADESITRTGLLATPHESHTQAQWIRENWEDIKVGDFVKLRCDESVPADLVIVATSEEENVCYVETKNLDGETNLKPRYAIPELAHLRTSTQISEQARFRIEAEPVDANMFRFTATVVMEDERNAHGEQVRCPVNLSTVLLRGTVVRNTDWVIGVVCMTGRDTKIVLNSGGTPSKRSRVERLMNPMVFINLFLLACMCVMCAVVDYRIQKDKVNKGAYWLFRDDRGDDNPDANAGFTFGNALITFQNIVPISLYISIEFVRVVQAFFIYMDPYIVYKVNGRKQRTVAKSWNLSDDLGQIEYIFSDKTGTLTQNVMVFRECSVGGKVYVTEGEKADEGAGGNYGEAKTPGAAPSYGSSTTFVSAEVAHDLAEADSVQAQNLYNFFSNLALCHTVLIAEEDGQITYKAQSPDEAALVQAAADAGFVFLGRDKNILHLQTPQDHEVVDFELLNVLEFSSARKRMSVVVRRVSDDDDAPLLLLTKGADNVIYERLGPQNAELKAATNAHLDEFAGRGLRTLCLACKPLGDAEYAGWERDFHAASTAIENREAEMERVMERLETGLYLLGATAIEDKLQDGVPEAIADLKRAGLKIWVATGDKLETAIAIGKTCNLLSRDMNIIVIRGGEYESGGHSVYRQIQAALSRFFDAGNLASQQPHVPPDAQEQFMGAIPDENEPGLHRTTTNASHITDIVGEDNGSRPGGYGLVIDGASLNHAFAEPFTEDLLLELATRCRAVICCRTSPLQKALIVRLVKDNLGSMCLAIGDGANDVSMIQAADIGVGVSGEEGLQAVNASDYAIAQFAFLKRLLLVHGHWSYMRNANMIVNFFFKEIIGIGILFWFQFFCGYSASTVYEYTYLLFWNIVWTLLPVIAIGIFDRNIPDNVLMAIPELYKVNANNALFGIGRFIYYMFDGIYESAMVYFFVQYAYDTTTVRRDGFTIDLYEFSTVMALGAILACNIFNGLNTYAWNWWILGSVLFGPVIALIYTAIYAAFPPSLLWTYMYGYNHFLWNSFFFYWFMILSIVLAVLPRFLYRFIKENYFYDDIDILRYTTKVDPNHDWLHDPAMPRPVESYAAEPAPAGFRESLQLARLGTRASVTHDMSTGLSRQGLGLDRGFGFDQADNVAPPSIMRYTSRGSDGSARPRPRKGSIRLGNVELNPFVRGGGSRTKGNSLGIFNKRRPTVVEEDEEPNN